MSKKLLVVSRSTVFHHKAGGLETQLDNLLNYLKKHFQITVLTTSKVESAERVETLEKDSIKYIFLPNTVPGEYGYSLYECLFWQVPFKLNFKCFGKNFRSQAANYFAANLKGNFNLILSQSSSAQSFDISSEKLVAINHGTTLNEIKSRYSSVKSVKDVVRFLMLDVPTLIYEYFFNNPSFFHKLSKIVLVSETLKTDFQNQHSAFSEKVTVISNGINTNKFKPALKKDMNKIVYFGRIDAEKGVYDFMKVAKVLPKYNFEIYGDGPDAEFIAHQALEQKNVRYSKSVSNDEIASVLSDTSIFLFLTQRKEGMPMSLLEALSSGCLVVSTLSLENTGCYGYYQVEDYKKASELIPKLLTSNKFSKIVSETRKNALSNFSYISMGKKYLSLLNEL